jgi:pimeloyl-ACP methyl ester carboxylesterase
VIRPVDLGVCRGYEWEGDAARTAVVLPGAMLGGTPSCYYAASALNQQGWRVVQVWDEFPGGDRVAWPRSRAEAALDHAGSARILAGKSAGTLAAAVAAERGLAGVWLTPVLNERVCTDGLRARSAPALLVGGTDDPVWDGALARELGDEVLELDGADHGLARIDHLQAIVDAVVAFAARLA